MRVLVCGGRDFDDADFVYGTLDKIRATATEIIQGGALGADHWARVWAEYNQVGYTTYEADWKAHGRAAGPIRNQEMIDEGKPDLVIAFPGGRGTADMVRRAKAAGIPVEEIGRPSTSM